MASKKHLIILLMIFLIISHHISLLFSQQLTTIQGRITQNNGNPLPGANIVILSTKWGAAADRNGYYSIKNIPPGNYAIEASFIGFEPMRIKEIVLKSGEKKIINFSLEPKVVKLNTVKVEAERMWDNHVADVSLVGVQRMNSKQIVNTPGAFDDPIRAAQIFSGVTGVGDFSSFLAVRGGSPDQNLVIMDDVVIPNPYRFRLAMGGGLSIFDHNITQDVYLHLGGFSAEYGNRLSSVLEIETRNGSRDKLGIKGSINLTDASCSIEGPIP